MELHIPLEIKSKEFSGTLDELDKGIELLAATLNKKCRARVHFGVDGTGEIVGLDKPIGKNTIRKIERRISELIKPAVEPEIVYRVYGKRRIISVEVRGNRRPYSCDGDYLIHEGYSSRKIEPDLLRDLFLSSDSVSIDSTESIDQKLSFNMMKQMYANRGLSAEKPDFEENTGLLVNGKYNCLAQLLADENDVSLKVVRFQGTDKRKMISRNEYGYKCLLVSMQQVSNYIESLNETKVDLESGMFRKEEKLFDMHVFEEAWDNACLHNRWIRNIPPAVYIFSDRIEIVSTGGLPFDLSEEDFYRGVSHPVNPGLQRIMGQLGIVEQTGHGNLVIVSRYGREAFEISDSHITVKIPFAFEPSMNTVSSDGMHPSQQKVLKAIKDNPQLSQKQLAAICGLSVPRLAQIVSYLKQTGRIERIGSNRNGYWEVK